MWISKKQWKKLEKRVAGLEKQTALYGKQSEEKRLVITRLWNEGKITKNEAAILAGFAATGEKGNVIKIRLESP